MSFCPTIRTAAALGTGKPICDSVNFTGKQDSLILFLVLFERVLA